MATRFEGALRRSERRVDDRQPERSPPRPKRPRRRGAIEKNSVGPPFPRGSSDPQRLIPSP